MDAGEAVVMHDGDLSAAKRSGSAEVDAAVSFHRASERSRP
jgi:hypothetical protein